MAKGTRIITIHIFLRRLFSQHIIWTYLKYRLSYRSIICCASFLNLYRMSLDRVAENGRGHRKCRWMLVF